MLDESHNFMYVKLEDIFQQRMSNGNQGICLERKMDEIIIEISDV